MNIRQDTFYSLVASRTAKFSAYTQLNSMSVRAPVSFSIHNENESSFQRSILKQSNSSFVPNSITLGDTASIVKPTLAPKNARKALSTINNNVLNNRALISGSSLTDGNASNASFGTQLTIEKKPQVQVVAVPKVVPTTTVQHSFIIPPVMLFSFKTYSLSVLN